jgi:hypothetical protein
MSVEVDDDRNVYVSTPRHTASSDGGHRIVLRPGQPLRPPSAGPLEHFLTARWGAYH